MIEVNELSKIFRKPVRGTGVSGMVKTLFSRKYEEIRAVDGISFTVPDGQIMGYIGANGAGKSTTIKMMCGILTPTSGSILIDGAEPYKKRQQVAQHIGVVFGQKTQLWWDIPLIESFKVLKEIYRISDADYKERMDFLGEVLDITRFLTQPVRTLSLGERMRADLAASMLHNPRILFLDEPTIGMDVLVKEKIRQAIHALNRRDERRGPRGAHPARKGEDPLRRAAEQSEEPLRQHQDPDADRSGGRPGGNGAGAVARRRSLRGGRPSAAALRRG